MRAQVGMEYLLLLAAGIVLVSIVTSTALMSGKTIYEQISATEAGEYNAPEIPEADINVSIDSYPNSAIVGNDYTITVSVKGDLANYTLILEDSGAEIIPVSVSGSTPGTHSFTWSPITVGTHKVTAYARPTNASDPNPSDNKVTVEINVSGVPTVVCPFNEGCTCLQYFLDYYKSYSGLATGSLTITFGKDIPWDDEVNKIVEKKDSGEECAYIDYDYPVKIIIDMNGGKIFARDLNKAIVVDGGSNVVFSNGSIECEVPNNECVDVVDGSLGLSNVSITETGVSPDVPLYLSNAEVNIENTVSLITTCTLCDPVFTLLDNGTINFLGNAFLVFESSS